MPATSKAARTHVWMESLGDWSWPGTRAPAVEMMPPAWVPASPPRIEPVVGTGALALRRQRRARRVRVLLALPISVLAALCVGLAIDGPRGLERLVGYGAGAPVARFETATPAPSAPLPTLSAVSSDAAGSSIDSTTYASRALHGGGSFYVYLPPGFASTTARYPVLYLLHGNSQPATAFLEVGLQSELDQLIAEHKIEPLIAVMIQGGAGANNWRDQGRLGYESYVLEVQQLVDRMLPTIAARSARAIAGDSMGGYGAMNIALGNPYRFAVVESWLGFFNGLEGELGGARPVIERLGLHAFVYGAEGDRIADPAENAPFAHALRAAGASAHSAVYPGEHSLATVEAHLANMLTYVGRALLASERAAAARARVAAIPQEAAARHPSALRHGAG
jgi:enterochelin esterase-like enzyme